MYYKNGERKNISKSILRGDGTFFNSAKKLQIDTLFVEDNTIHAGSFANDYHVKTYKTKYLVINNVAYSLNIDEIDCSKIQGFQAVKRQYNKRPKGIVTLSNAIIIDDEEDNIKGYFANSEITKVIFSSKIKKIGKGAFRGCVKLREVVFPDGIGNVEIALDAFAGCENLDMSGIKVPNEQNELKKEIEHSASLLIDESPNKPREIKWSSQKNYEAFDIPNCYLFFDKCKYQYFKNGDKIIRHGEIECTNGKYHFIYQTQTNSVVNVKGTYKNGKKHGQWYYQEEFKLNGIVCISAVKASFKNGIVDGKYIYVRKEGNDVTEQVRATYSNGKPYGEYYESRAGREITVYFDEQGEKTGPLHIKEPNQEHFGNFKQGVLVDYYYIDLKTKEKFEPADNQGKTFSINFLQFYRTVDYPCAGIVLCEIVGTGNHVK
jgi:hypothetical protein